MNDSSQNRSDAQVTEQERRDLRRAEVGDKRGADRLDQAEHAHAEAAEAVEQVAADGAGKRGVAR